MIRSGLSWAISVKFTPSDSSMVLGAVPPSSETLASNQSVEPLSLPPHATLVMPTGTTPSAATKSWVLLAPTHTTRSGAFSTVVDPRACFTVTGNVSVGVEDVEAPGAASEPPPSRDPVEHAASPIREATARPDPSRERRLS